MSHGHSFSQGSEVDQVLVDIADYVINWKSSSEEAFRTARYAAIDAIGCGLLALQFPECTKHLGPVVPGTVVPNGNHVPGTQFVLDPILAAFNIGCINRWLDFNDTWLGKEWGHPSDNLASVLAVAEYVSRNHETLGLKVPTMKDVLDSLIKAYEIQGVIALENSFNRVGLDHVVLVKVASTAVSTLMLGGSRQEIINAVSNAWIDGQSLRTYRHFPNTGSRKSWAAGDAASRAVRLSLMSLKGEMGYNTALTAKVWGFYDVHMKGEFFKFQRPYGSYVMENVLFKVSFPAEYHAQTSVECGVKLHEIFKSKGGVDAVQSIVIITHESAIRIIDKKGPLKNPADRDHCIQYMTAVALLEGNLVAEHYENEFVHAHPEIDRLRELMVCQENLEFSKDYLDPEKRSIANSVTITFKDGMVFKEEVQYPIGHRRRRAEAIPLIEEKFSHALKTRFPPKQVQKILSVCLNQEAFEKLPVTEFMQLFVI
eukprot:TRINITY_DN8454_c0_g1_i1.p1 TRINITY_DN8454_c0_g1~~TRINITY_DN8454_c0_g1_i1.p1  ORF type:complete len:484 (-),score=105.18 TRINITY_DN8454_c0_g1_i1:106-1557(-)